MLGLNSHYLPAELLENEKTLNKTLSSSLQNQLYQLQLQIIIFCLILSICNTLLYSVAPVH